MEKNTDFSLWLSREINKRGWSQSYLADKSGISRSQISRILAGTRGVGNNTGIALARALKIPVERVFHKAGLMPPTVIGDKLDEETQEMISYFQYLDKNDRHTIRVLAQTLYEKRATIKPKKEKNV